MTMPPSPHDLIVDIITTASIIILALALIALAASAISTLFA